MKKVNVSDVIKIQALIRGFLQRQKFKLLSVAFNKLFKREEYTETLGKGQHSDQLVAVTYHYKSSGAVYTGYMLKGLRESSGIMNWKDGSRYEGHWKDGLAHG